MMEGLRVREVSVRFSNYVFMFPQVASRQWCNTGASGKYIVPAPVMEYQRQWRSTSHQRQPFPM